MKDKTNSQLIHEELWNVVRSVNNRTLNAGEADAITNAVGKMIGVALLEIKAKEMGIKNPLDQIDAHKGKRLEQTERV
jgi:Holliday junction resolvase-like predicted endonuclease